MKSKAHEKLKLQYDYYKHWSISIIYVFLTLLIVNISVDDPEFKPFLLGCTIAIGILFFLFQIIANKKYRELLDSYR